MPGTTPPTHAVILAGGRGERLRPLTDALPKPMIQLHGRPFLEYLVELLARQGIERITVLVGYRAEMIRDYFGNGARHGVRMDYAYLPPEMETGPRLRQVASQLDDVFLLMYCDNYWPLLRTRLWQQYSQAGLPAMVTVYANRDGYSRNNVETAEGRVLRYEPGRNGAGLNGVEIGYALLHRSILDALPGGNVRFEHTIYPLLAAEGRLGAFVTEHRYYSIGSASRLPLTEAFLLPQRAVLLDRDGVLNERPPRAQYVRSWDEFQWRPGAVEALRLLRSAGYRLILITNQPGVARGVMTEGDVAGLHERLRETLAAAGAPLAAIYVCMHGWDEGCRCRKPKPGLLFDAQRDFHLDLTRTPYIGDDERDLLAGQAVGCPTFLVSPQISLLEIARTYLPSDEQRVNA